MSLRVTVEDIEEGGSETVVVPDGEYFILTTTTCYVASQQVYPKAGTVVLTIKGRNPKRAAASTQSEERPYDSE
jgi:hypothetical protein